MANAAMGNAAMGNAAMANVAMGNAGIRAAALMTICLIALGSQSAAQTLSVTGQSGVLGEWEVTAIVTKQHDGGDRRWSGPLSLKHIGFWQRGRAGRKNRRIVARCTLPIPLARGVTATLLIEGEACTFKGLLKDGSDGVMTCPDRPDVPMMLMLQ